MKIVISNTSDIPLYQQIKDQIKDAILKEELVEGDPLPSIRGFANDLKVSVLTIRRVYEELEQEGFVVSQVGIGTFVSASNVELLRDAKRRLVEQKMQDIKQCPKKKETMDETIERRSGALPASMGRYREGGGLHRADPRRAHRSGALKSTPG